MQNEWQIKSLEGSVLLASTCGYVGHVVLVAAGEGQQKQTKLLFAGGGVIQIPLAWFRQPERNWRRTVYFPGITSN